MVTYTLQASTLDCNILLKSYLFFFTCFKCGLTADCDVNSSRSRSDLQAGKTVNTGNGSEYGGSRVS